MVCPNCKAIIVDDAHFCPKCNARFDVSLRPPSNSGINNPKFKYSVYALILIFIMITLYNARGSFDKSSSGNISEDVQIITDETGSYPSILDFYNEYNVKNWGNSNPIKANEKYLNKWIKFRNNFTMYELLEDENGYYITNPLDVEYKRPIIWKIYWDKKYLDQIKDGRLWRDGDDRPMGKGAMIGKVVQLKDQVIVINTRYVAGPSCDEEKSKKYYAQFAKTPSETPQLQPEASPQSVSVNQEVPTQPIVQNVKEFKPNILLGAWSGNINDKIIILEIEKIIDNSIYGYNMIVNGKKREIKGLYFVTNDVYEIRLKEPGDDEWDGMFELKMQNDSKYVMKGKWESNNGKVTKTVKLTKLNPIGTEQ